MNRQALEEYISAQFGAAGERLWRAWPDYVVFRNPRNKKWFAVLMDVEKSRLGLAGGGKADVINLKCEPILVGSLLQSEGCLPAYHMNKTNWITVLLEGGPPPEELRELLRISYDVVDRK